MKKKQIVVTGGAGFIGCNLAQALNARGHDDLIIVDHLNHPLKERNLNSLQCADYLDRADFRAALARDKFSGIKAILHMGACSSTTETDQAYLNDNNVAYTRELGEWCLRKNARFVYASSAATYGDGTLGYDDDHQLVPRLRPLNLYGQSKQDFDLFALNNGWLDQIAGLKYFNVFGPYEDHKCEMRSLVQKAYHQVLATGELALFRSHRPEYRDGEQVRDFIYVKDAVAVTLFLLDHPDRNGLFNCGTGRAHSWIELANAVFAALDRPPSIRFIDMPESIRDKYQYHTEAKIEKLRAAGYDRAFTPLHDAVSDYVRNFLAATDNHKPSN